jgi:perosamine synthetase
MRSLGIEKDVSLRYKGERAWEYDVASQGFRYHMSNINAAIGLAQIKKVEQNRLRKLEIYQRYLCEFEKFGIHRFLVVTQKFNPACNYHLFSCLLDDRYSREALRSFLKEKQIESGIHYAPNHLHSFYRSAYQLPITEKIGAQTISLPFHPSLSDHEVTQVIEALVEFFRIVQPRPLNQTDQN